MTKDCISEYIERNFSDKQKVHTYAVRDMAIILAEHYAALIEKAEMAALFHDLFRGVSLQILNYYIKELKLEERYVNNANLAHGKVAAVIIQRDYGICDEDIINAVKYHTTGRAGMSKLEKVVYLADAIEINRNYPGVEELRAIAFDGLDEACLAALKQSRSYIKERGLFFDPDTEKAIADLENKVKAGKLYG